MRARRLLVGVTTLASTHIGLILIVTRLVLQWAMRRCG